jgi:16S rRNA A1518/A1519 N6-dimethyltransferase RsmA/KsgA/DIM1 with predicted DNA glycosylase/AP lyase activity
LGTNTSELIAAAGLDPTARAEDVPVEEFVLLARILRDQRDRSSPIENQSPAGDKTP